MRLEEVTYGASRNRRGFNRPRSCRGRGVGGGDSRRPRVHGGRSRRRHSGVAHTLRVYMGSQFIVYV